MTASPAIVIAYIPEGKTSPSYHVIGEGALLFVVDENSPHDRVYEITTRAPAERFRELIPLSAVFGHCGDDKHAGVTAKILDYIESAS